MKNYILILALTFSGFAVHAENNSIFDYDQAEVIKELEKRYGPVEGSLITFESNTVWVKKGKRACGFFVEGTNWGLFSRDGKQVLLGFDSAAGGRKPDVRFLHCYRYR